MPLWTPLSHQHNRGTEQSYFPSSGPSVGGQVVERGLQEHGGIRTLDGGTAFRVTAIISLWTSCSSDPPQPL